MITPIPITFLAPFHILNDLMTQYNINGWASWVVLCVVAIDMLLPNNGSGCVLDKNITIVHRHEIMICFFWKAKINEINTCMENKNYIIFIYYQSTSI